MFLPLDLFLKIMIKCHLAINQAIPIFVYVLSISLVLANIKVIYQLETSLNVKRFRVTSSGRTAHESKKYAKTRN